MLADLVPIGSLSASPSPAVSSYSHTPNLASVQNTLPVINDRALALGWFIEPLSAFLLNTD